MFENFDIFATWLLANGGLVLLLSKGLERIPAWKGWKHEYKSYVYDALAVGLLALATWGFSAIPADMLAQINDAWIYVAGLYAVLKGSKVNHQRSK